MISRYTRDRILNSKNAPEEKSEGVNVEVGSLVEDSKQSIKNEPKKTDAEKLKKKKD